jgi:N-acetylglutamate synthase-like GNAT family acetyltransferase
MYKEKIVGFVALKRLDDDSFELTKLYINPNYRNIGIDLKLIERCISRCMENEARELWLQTSMQIPDTHLIYLALGFIEKAKPAQMTVQEQTKKVMCLDL